VIALHALDEDQRQVSMSAHTPAGQQWLNDWMAGHAG
jgi:hypothetical protein